MEARVQDWELAWLGDLRPRQSWALSSRRSRMSKSLEMELYQALPGKQKDLGVP